MAGLETEGATLEFSYDAPGKRRPPKSHPGDTKELYKCAKCENENKTNKAVNTAASVACGWAGAVW